MSQEYLPLRIELSKYCEDLQLTSEKDIQGRIILSRKGSLFLGSDPYRDCLGPNFLPAKTVQLCGFIEFCCTAVAGNGSQSVRTLSS